MLLFLKLDIMQNLAHVLGILHVRNLLQMASSLSSTV